MAEAATAVGEVETARRGRRAAGTTPQVALLVETSTEFGRGLLRGILRYSRLHGPWSLLVAPGHLGSALAQLGRWRADGVIARVRSADLRQVMHSTRLPLVASSLDEAPAPLLRAKLGEIRTDPGAIARMAAEHLAEAGFRRLAFCGFQGCAWSLARENAFLRLAASRGYACDQYRIALASWLQKPHWISTSQHQQPDLARWLGALPKPVGLMACNDICGRDVLQACAAAGLRVPDDVAVVGVDNDEMMCELASPPLSSVELDVEQAGYAAAALLDRLMREPATADECIVVQPRRVVARGSSDVVALEDSLVAAALRYMREHAKEPIDVGKVVRGLGVSRRTLERRFLAALGRGVSTEIARYHLERAKRLLLETKLPTYRIAAEAGYGSVKTLRRAFLHHAACTPERFRQNERSRLF